MNLIFTSTDSTATNSIWKENLYEKLSFNYKLKWSGATTSWVLREDTQQIIFIIKRNNERRKEKWNI